MVERFDPPRDLDWKPLPMRPDIAGQYARYSDLAKARAENERLQTIIDNLHAVEQKHRETANAEFHRANRLQVENERLREALKGMDLEAQRETVEAMLKPTLIHLVMKMSDDARATLAIMTGAAKGASDGGL